ncbi:Heat stress transcription factor A-1-like protein [Drosera capensis]
MVKKSNNGDGGSSPAPFLLKLYEMVDNGVTDSVIVWSDSGDSFLIWDVTEFSRDVAQGFRKVDTDRWEFGNEGFIKDQNHLLSNIKRRKNPPGSVQLKSSEGKPQPMDELKEIHNSHLQKEVETLKSDKNLLMQELVKLRERQVSSQNKLLVLQERLQGMETNQQHLLAFIPMVAQSPGFLVQLCQQKDGNWRVAEAGKITPLRQGNEDGKALSADHVIVRYQPSSAEAQVDSLPPSNEAEKTSEPDVLFDGDKVFFMNIDFPPLGTGDNLHPIDNHGQIIIPELDLNLLEQYLLGSPTREDSENIEYPEDESVSGRVWTQICTGFNSGNPQSTETYDCLFRDAGNHPCDLDILTTPMWQLSPGKTRKNEAI